MIAERLRLARDLGSVSARELSTLAGLPSATHVGGIERGDSKNPEGRTMAKLAGVLGCSLAWLITGEGDVPDAATVRAAVEAARARRADESGEVPAATIATGTDK